MEKRKEGSHNEGSKKGGEQYKDDRTQTKRHGCKIKQQRVNSERYKKEKEETRNT